MNAFMLAEGVGVYELAAMGRSALEPMIEALEDPETDPAHTVYVAMRVPISIARAVGCTVASLGDYTPE